MYILIYLKNWMNFVLQFLLGHDTFLGRNEYVKVTDANTQIKIPAKIQIYCTYEISVNQRI
jgi:hypothetical protein